MRTGRVHKNVPFRSSQIYSQHFASMWIGHSRIDLGTPDEAIGSDAVNINDADQVIGNVIFQNYRFRAVLWQNGTQTGLGTLAQRDHIDPRSHPKKDVPHTDALSSAVTRRVRCMVAPARFVRRLWNIQFALEPGVDCCGRGFGDRSVLGRGVTRTVRPL